jgi:transposase
MLSGGCAGMSLEQLEELAKMARAAGHGKPGRSRTLLDNTLALRHLAQYEELGLSHDAAVKATAKAELASPHTIRAAAEQFISTGSMPTVPSTAHRGRGNPDHPLHTSNTEKYGPSFEAELLMHELVYKQKTEGVSITSTTIAAELRQRLDVKVDRSTVRRWLRALGYRWRHKRYVGGMKPQAKQVRIRQFILEYATALSEEEAGRAIIVYVDESWIYAHLASKKGWFHPTDSRRK